MTETTSVTHPMPKRMLSLDAHRGFVMFVLLSGFFGLSALARVIPGQVGEFMRHEFSHVDWTGCALWDLIQPSFTFIVGVSMPLSYAARKARGQSEGRIFGHAVSRAIILILLGLVLRSNGKDYTYFTFEDVIQQIGLGYLFVYALMGRGVKVQAIAATVVLVGYWLLFALWPLPGEGFDAAAIGLPEHWQYFREGFAQHWNLGANPAGYFDKWFLNLFPRQNEWTFHGGGYVTLSFIPSAVTILFGVMAGEWMMSDRSMEEKCKRLFLLGLACLGFGFMVDGNIWPIVDWNWSIAPIVKKIWTPSWTIFSAGWALLSLAFFVWSVEIRGWRKWTFPFVVVGMNCIVVYVIEGMFFRPIMNRLEAHFQLDQHFGFPGLFSNFAMTVLLVWLLCLWMYKRKIFIRI